MGMFTQKPEEPTEWAGLPSEPYDRDDATDLLDAPAADPLGLGIGPATSSLSITAIPAAPSVAPVEPDDEGAAAPETAV